MPSAAFSRGISHLTVCVPWECHGAVPSTPSVSPPHHQDEPLDVLTPLPRQTAEMHSAEAVQIQAAWVPDLRVWKRDGLSSVSVLQKGSPGEPGTLPGKCWLCLPEPAAPSGHHGPGLLDSVSTLPHSDLPRNLHGVRNLSEEIQTINIKKTWWKESCVESWGFQVCLSWASSRPRALRKTLRPPGGLGGQGCGADQA